MTADAAPHLPLPRWVYMPGGALPPDTDALDRAVALVPARFDGRVPRDHPALAYGLALNDAGFFWEAHEVLEAVWRAAPPGGRDRILLRACIQVANAGLKHRLGRGRAVARLIAEAVAELEELAVRGSGPAGSFADGYPVAKLRRDLGGTTKQPPTGGGWISLATAPPYVQENAHCSAGQG